MSTKTSIEKIQDNLKSILGWRELRSGQEVPIERIEDITRETLRLFDEQIESLQRRVEELEKEQDRLSDSSKTTASDKPAFILLEDIHEALRNYLILCCDKEEGELYCKKLSEIAMDDFNTFIDLGGEQLFEAVLLTTKEPRS